MLECLLLYFVPYLEISILCNNFNHIKLNDNEKSPATIFFFHPSFLYAYRIEK